MTFLVKATIVPNPDGKGKPYLLIEPVEPVDGHDLHYGDGKIDGHKPEPKKAKKT